MEGVCAYDREQDEAGQGCALKKKEAGEGYDVHVFRAARWTVMISYTLLLHVGEQPIGMTFIMGTGSGA